MFGKYYSDIHITLFCLFAGLFATTLGFSGCMRSASTADLENSDFGKMPFQIGSKGLYSLLTPDPLQNSLFTATTEWRLPSQADGYDPAQLCWAAKEPRLE